MKLINSLNKSFLIRAAAVSFVSQNNSFNFCN